MSSVFSKLIDKTSSRYGVRQETLTRGVVGTVTVLYLLKLTYPHVVKLAGRLNNGEKKPIKKPECRKNGKANGIAITGKRVPNVGLDRAFVKQLLDLLKIMVPGWRSKEAGLLTCATITLLARTFLSVYVATLEGQIVKRIVLKDVKGFFRMMARWFAVALPATFVNSAIRYLEGRLALSFRY